MRLAEYYRASGADVIDLGCSLDRKFGDVGEVVSLLRARGFSLSIDTLDPVEILAADRAGVDYVLTSTGRPCDVAREPGRRRCRSQLPGGLRHPGPGRRSARDARPALHPGSRDRAGRVRIRRGARPLRPGARAIPGRRDADGNRQHHGADRRRHDGHERAPHRVLQELGIRQVLATEVIPWARGAVREVDVARQLMYAARRRGVLPKRIDDRLLTVKDSRPKSYTEPELRAFRRRSRTRTSGSPRPVTPSTCSTTACS